MVKLLPLFLVLFAGCATFQSTGRQVVYHAGVTIAAVDAQTAPAYEKAAQDALGASQSLDEYEGYMAPWNALEEALRASWEAVGALESTLDAYVAGSEGNVIGAVLALVQVLGHLRQVLEPLLPQSVGQVLQLLDELLQFLPQPLGNQ